MGQHAHAADLGRVAPRGAERKIQERGGEALPLMLTIDRELAEQEGWYGLGAVALCRERHQSAMKAQSGVPFAALHDLKG